MLNYIVEIGQSHGGSIERAKKSLRDISDLTRKYSRGVKFYAKFQMFHPYNLFFDRKDDSPYPEAEAQLTSAQLGFLMEYGRARGVTVFASALDSHSLNAYWGAIIGSASWGNTAPIMLKVASRSHANKSGIGNIYEAILRTFVQQGPWGLPTWTIDTLVVSTGDVRKKKNRKGNTDGLKKHILASMAPLAPKIVFLYCVPEYPHKFSAKEKYEIEQCILGGTHDGASDHSRYDDNSVLDAVLWSGGTWYERHFTDNRGLTVIDKDCSQEASEVSDGLDTHFQSE